MKMEDIVDSMILKILSQYEKIVLTKNSSSSLLGSMNDLVFLYTHFVLSEGGLKHANLNDVIFSIIRTLQINLDGLDSASLIRKLTTVNLN